MALPEKGQAANLSSEQANWRLLVLLSGPSGVGKGTIGARLRELLPEMVLVPSATTRGEEPRDAEGEYLYVSQPEFEQMWDAGELLEADPHFEDWYGLTNPGPNALGLSDVDVKGSTRLYEAGLPRLLRIALLPPGDTIQEMVDVCTNRMQSSRDDAAGIAKRQARAEEEIGIIVSSWLADQRAEIIVNDDLDLAVADCLFHIKNHLAMIAR